MKNKFIAALRNQFIATFIVVGGIIVAIPVFICLLARRACVFGVSWAVPRAPVAVRKLRQLAELAEVHISGHMK